VKPSCFFYPMKASRVLPYPRSTAAAAPSLGSAIGRPIGYLHRHLLSPQRLQQIATESEIEIRDTARKVAAPPATPLVVK
jgi:hypothetical protein